MTIVWENLVNKRLLLIFKLMYIWQYLVEVNHLHCIALCIYQFSQKDPILERADIKKHQNMTWGTKRGKQNDVFQ